MRQHIENDIAETEITREPSIFILKTIFDIFYISNSLLTHLDELILTFGIKPRENEGKERLEAVELIERSVTNIG